MRPKTRHVASLLWPVITLGAGCGRSVQRTCARWSLPDLGACATCRGCAPTPGEARALGQRPPDRHTDDARGERAEEIFAFDGAVAEAVGYQSEAACQRAFKAAWVSLLRSGARCRSCPAKMCKAGGPRQRENQMRPTVMNRRISPGQRGRDAPDPRFAPTAPAPPTPPPFVTGHRQDIE